MSYWRSDSPDVQSAAIDSSPATDDIYIGTAFNQQSNMGVDNTTLVDDRLTYMAGIRSDTANPVATGLGGSPEDDGYQAVYGGTSLFTGVTYGEEQDIWYDTLRPTAGYPLIAVPDMVYANATNDVVGDTVNEEIDPLLPLDFRLIMEKSKDYPSRLSGHPAELQAERPWDIVMGAWPWTGEKAALQRPVATTPLTFDTGIVDSSPVSSTGTRNADQQSGMSNVDPYPVTYRFTPIPWDTGDSGYYVDSGV